MFSFSDKLRHALHSLESNTDLRNLIGEEENVVEAYKIIVKQKNEAVQYFKKWGVHEGSEVKALFAVIQDVNASHSLIFQDFVKQYSEYVHSLKAILVMQEKLITADKKVKELEEKLEKAKKKGASHDIDEQQLRDAKASRDHLSEELEVFKENTVRSSLVNLTKAYLDLYNHGIQIMTKQLNGLNQVQAPETKSNLSASSDAHPQSPAVQQQPPAVQQQSPAVQQQPPAVQQQAPVVQQQPPAVQQQPPAVQQQQAPVVQQQQAPVVQQQAPVVQQQPPVVQQQAPVQ
jgi:hypothetical protein